MASQAFTPQFQFGFAQLSAKSDQPKTWIYTVTAAVDNPKIHPPD